MIVIRAGFINTSHRGVLKTGGVHTEGQPGLSDLQVDGEVRLQAQVTDGDVRARLSLQTRKLHVTVGDAFW